MSEQVSIDSEVVRLREENAILARENRELISDRGNNESKHEVERLRRENASLSKKNFLLKHKQSRKQISQLKSVSKIDGTLKNILIESLRGKLERNELDNATTDHIIQAMEVMNEACNKKLSEVYEERHQLEEELEKCRFERKTERNVWKFKLEKLRTERSDLRQELTAVKHTLAHKKNETEKDMHKVKADMSKTSKERDSEMKTVLKQLHSTIHKMNLDIGAVPNAGDNAPAEPATVARRPKSKPGLQSVSKEMPTAAISSVSKGKSPPSSELRRQLRRSLSVPAAITPRSSKSAPSA